MFDPMRCGTLRQEVLIHFGKTRMSKFAIRLLTLAVFATSLTVAPLISPANAAADSTKPTKKKHKTMSTRGSQMEVPRTSTQTIRNMSDDPDRKVGY
jgi:hypothetical protein